MSIELILGFIGTITGIIGLLLHYITFQKEKPRLKFELTKCEHSFYPARSHFRLDSVFRVRNVGDRGTTITKAGLSFKLDEKIYSVPYHCFITFPGANLVLSLWIDAHETIDEFLTIFEIKGETITQESLDCTFTLYHTHGKETIRGTSTSKQK